MCVCVYVWFGLRFGFFFKPWVTFSFIFFLNRTFSYILQWSKELANKLWLETNDKFYTIFLIKLQIIWKIYNVFTIDYLFTNRVNAVVLYTLTSENSVDISFPSLSFSCFLPHYWTPSTSAKFPSPRHSSYYGYVLLWERSGFLLLPAGPLAWSLANRKINGAVPGPEPTLSPACRSWRPPTGHGREPRLSPFFTFSSHFPIPSPKSLLYSDFPNACRFFPQLILLPNLSLLLRHLGTPLLCFIVIYLFHEKFLNQMSSFWTAGRESFLHVLMYPSFPSPNFPIPSRIQDKAMCSPLNEQMTEFLKGISDNFF